MKKKIFLDASALFAAAYSSGGAARELLRLGLEGRVALVTNEIAIEEAERNLATKAPAGIPIFRALIEALPLVILPVPTLSEVEPVAKIVVSKDAPIVAGALASQADYLATFDRQHLINLDISSLSSSLIIALPGDILRNVR